jgi:hypothetical protein
MKRLLALIILAVAAVTNAHCTYRLWYETHLQLSRLIISKKKTPKKQTLSQNLLARVTGNMFAKLRTTTAMDQ